MDISILADYMSPIIVVVCLCIGFIIKECISSVKINKFIPLIVGVVGIVFNVWACAAINVEVIAIGLVSGLASTGFYELFKNLLENAKSLSTKKGE